MNDSNLYTKIEMPEGVEVKLEGTTLHVKGPKGDISRPFADPVLERKVSGNAVELSYLRDTKAQKRKLNSTIAHVKNMIKGVNEGFTYTLKICSGHFPMSVNLKNGVFEVKNFVGESVPRRLKIIEGVDVAVNGDDITVQANNKEKAGQVAASIEKLCKRPGFDKRIFQDGIYITAKPTRY